MSGGAIDAVASGTSTAPPQNDAANGASRKPPEAVRRPAKDEVDISSEAMQKNSKAPTAATASNGKSGRVGKPRLTSEQSDAVAKTIIEQKEKGATLEQRNKAVGDQIAGFRKANAAAEAKKNTQAPAPEATGSKPKTAEKPANDLATAVANTIAVQTEKGASREGIAAAVEREIQKFQKSKASEAAEAAAATDTRGGGVSASQQQDLQLLREVADRVSSRQGGAEQLLALQEAATKVQSPQRGPEDPSRQSKGSLVDLLG